MRYTAAGLYENLTRFPLLPPDHDGSTVGANIGNLIQNAKQYSQGNCVGVPPKLIKPFGSISHETAGAVFATFMCCFNDT